MTYPKLVINTDAIRDNSKQIIKLCSSFNVQLVGVTKVTLGNPVICSVMKESGIEVIGESRIQNIQRLIKNGINGPFMLLRIPMKSELRETVKLCDFVLVSEPQVAEWIDELSREIQKTVTLIYMVDVGDLREGVWYERAVEEISSVMKSLRKSKIAGIGTNLGCYGGILPDRENMLRLIEIKDQLERRTHAKIDIVSGGNTSALKLLEDGSLPEGINQFRVGEAIILGTDVTRNRSIPGLRQDTVLLEAEIIEMKTKPSVPVGTIGRDAFGRVPSFEDIGLRKRVILALGEQDCVPAHLKPVIRGTRVIHGSSDHVVVDITEANQSFDIGDTMRFTMSYASLLRSMTSPHVEKVFV